MSLFLEMLPYMFCAYEILTLVNLQQPIQIPTLHTTPFILHPSYYTLHTTPLILHLHTTPFILHPFSCEKIFSCLAADVTRSDTPWGSKLPYFRQERSNCFKFGVYIEGFCLHCLLTFTLSITEIQLCKVNAHFPCCFTPIIYANHVQFNTL